MPHLPPSLSRRRHTLVLPHHHLAHMTAAGWTWCPLETGGLLLGAKTEHHTTVTHVVGSGPNSQHSRSRFDPDHEWQAAEVARIWQVDHSIEYLGDWHTHPGGDPKPSPLDLATLQHIATDTAARQPAPVMLIFGLGRNGSSSAAAVRHLATGRLVTLYVRVSSRREHDH